MSRAGSSIRWHDNPRCSRRRRRGRVCCISAGRRRRRLDDRRRSARDCRASTMMPPSAVSGLVERTDDLARCSSRRSATSSQIVLPETVRRVAMEKPGLAERPDHGRQTAGIVEILHQEAAGGHQIDDGRHAAAEPVPIVEAESHAEPAGEAIRWMTALVEPPIAPLTRMAFSNASPRQDPVESSCRRGPDRRCAARPSGRALCGASRRPGSRHCRGCRCRAPRPSSAMVEAVPMVMQCPAERPCPARRRGSPSSAIVRPSPPRRSARHRCRSRCSRPLKRPFSIGPPETAIVGRSQLAAPIRSAGVVLSQPTSRTTPSIGLPRIDSSTSMRARLRNSIAVGRRFDSPSDITGNSSGKPPAS